MFAIPSNKAPCLDGYSSAIFKAAWDIVGVGVDVSKAILEVLRISMMVRELISLPSHWFLR